MRTTRHSLVLLVVTLLCGVLAVGCDDVIEDPNFHTWCGDQLCSWKLESGAIRRTPTWHKKDFGVELLDSTDPGRVTALSQVGKLTPRCLEFTTIADVAAGAQVSIGVDFNDDGTIDYEQPIAATGFTEQKTQLTAPLRYSGIRFVISKKGTGRAVLAQMQVKSKDDCTAPPLELNAQPLGTPCSIAAGGEECSSGICCGGRCSECCAEPTFGEALPDGGIIKSEAVSCPGGAKCAHREGVTFSFLPTVPHQCDPGKGTHASGSECLVAADCTSGVCEGARWRGNNGNQVTPCPASFAETGLGCAVDGVRGGRCK